MLIDLDRQFVVVCAGTGIHVTSLGSLLLPTAVLAIGDDPVELLAECERILDAQHRELMDSAVANHHRDLQRMRDRFAELKSAMSEHP